MFPNPKNFPTKFFIVFDDFFVSRRISGNFADPITSVRTWQAAMFFAPMPKTRVNENNGLVLFQNNIRLAEVFVGVLAVAKT